MVWHGMIWYGMVCSVVRHDMWYRILAWFEGTVW